MAVPMIENKSSRIKSSLADLPSHLAERRADPRSGINE